MKFLHCLVFAVDDGKGDAFHPFVKDWIVATGAASDAKVAT